MRGRRIEEVKIGVNSGERGEARVMDHCKGLAFMDEMGSLACFEREIMETFLVSKPFFLSPSKDMI